jgi:predicted NUDIX family NTP pyrophosphohydrolase
MSAIATYVEMPRAIAVAQQYAALPWRISQQGRLEVLLVTSRRRGRWTVPKGWQVKGRSPVQSAEREAFDEAGVVGQSGSDSIGSYRYSRQLDDVSAEPRNVTVFGLHVRGTLLNWPESGQRKRQWWPIDEACVVVGEPGLAELLKGLRSHAGRSLAMDAGGDFITA